MSRSDYDRSTPYNGSSRTYSTPAKLQEQHRLLMLQWQDLTTRGRHIAVHMSQSRGLSASEMACWKLVGLVSNCDEWMALWRSEISAGWHGGASTRALNNVHHGSLAADQMPWKPHLPTALAPVTVSLLSLPIVSSGSSLEDAIKLS